MQFRPLASSSAGNAYVVTAGDAPPLLIECGIRAQDLRKELGFGLSRVAGCLLSHEHGDHARAVREVMRAGVDVWASEGTWDALDAGGHRRWCARPLQPVETGSWRFLPFDLRHDAAEPLGFLVLAPDGEKLVYATDTAYIPYRFLDPTIVAVECNYSDELLRDNVASDRIPAAQRNRVLRNHMSLQRLIEMLQANDLSSVKAIWLLHLSDDNSDSAMFKRAVQEVSGKPVHIAPKEQRDAC